MGEKQDAAAVAPAPAPEKKTDNGGGENKAPDAGKKEGGNGNGNVTVVLKVDLHCEGCAKKVKRSVRHIPGVDSVKADFTTNKLTVVGKVDPASIRDKVADKTKKKVDLISPQPAKKDKEGDKKPEEKKKDDEKKEEKKKDVEEKKPPKEPPVTTAVMKTRVHCDGCANKIKKILRKYDGVQEANVDLAKDQITVKGTMDLKQLLPYMNAKLKRPVEVAPPPPKKDGDDKKAKGGGDGGDDKKAKGGGDGGSDKKEGEKKKEGGGGGGGGDKKEKGGDTKAKSVSIEEGGAPKVEVNKMEYFANPYAFGGYGGGGPVPMYGYPNNHFDGQASSSNGYVTEHWHAPQQQYPPHPYYMHAPPPMQPDYYNMHATPPQMFSDENPNACSIM